MCNNALRFMMEGKYDAAFREVAYAIAKAEGYFHEDIAQKIKEKMGWSLED